MRPLEVDELRPQAELRVDKDALAAVLPVEAAGGIAEEHDGELKPLGLMHGHDLARQS